MTIPISEAALERAIIEMAEVLGWRVYSVRRSDRAIVNTKTGRGYPDLVMVRPPRIIFAELKSARGRLTSEQRDWLEALADVERAPEAFTWWPVSWTDGTIEEVLR